MTQIKEEESMCFVNHASMRPGKALGIVWQRALWADRYSRFLLFCRLAGSTKTQEVRGSSEYSGFFASYGLCLVSAAAALFNRRTVVRHASEWVRAAESDPTFAHLRRS